MDQTEIQVNTLTRCSLYYIITTDHAVEKNWKLCFQTVCTLEQRQKRRSFGFSQTATVGPPRLAENSRCCAIIECVNNATNFLATLCNASLLPSNLLSACMEIFQLKCKIQLQNIAYMFLVLLLFGVLFWTLAGKYLARTTSSSTIAKNCVIAWDFEPLHGECPENFRLPSCTRQSNSLVFCKQKCQCGPQDCLVFSM